MDEGRRASPPPLLAYTASHQQSARGGSKKRGASSSASRSGRGRQQKLQRRTGPQSRRKDAPVVFDEDARAEYLTGFHKRKQERIEHGRERARLREKEERRQMREDARKAKKEQAAENVRAEKQAYGAEDASDEEDTAGPGGREAALSPSAYETEEHHTTVTVQAWDPNAGDEQINDVGSSSHASSSARPSTKDVLPPSSRRMAKKLKSDETQRQREKMAQKLATKPATDRRGKLIADANAISSLLDDGTELAEELQEVKTAEANVKAGRNKDGTTKPTVRAKPFRYESKLDRAKARAAHKDANAKFAQKRKEAAILNGGRKTSRGGGKSGKAGRGGSKGRGRGGKR